MKEVVYIDTNDVYFWSNPLVPIYEKRQSDVKLNCLRNIEKEICYISSGD